MKKYFTIITACLWAVLLSSCLDVNLEDLEEYSGCDITNGDVYWRYYGTDKNPGSGETEVKQVHVLLLCLAPHLGHRIVHEAPHHAYLTEYFPSGNQQRPQHKYYKD